MHFFSSSFPSSVEFAAFSMASLSPGLTSLCPSWNPLPKRPLQTRVGRRLQRAVQQVSEGLHCLLESALR